MGDEVGDEGRWLVSTQGCVHPDTTAAPPLHPKAINFGDTPQGIPAQAMDVDPDHD